jgi:hypothetical protein
MLQAGQICKYGAPHLYKYVNIAQTNWGKKCGMEPGQIGHTPDQSFISSGSGTMQYRVFNTLSRIPTYISSWDCRCGGNWRSSSAASAESRKRKQLNTSQQSRNLKKQ